MSALGSLASARKVQFCGAVVEDDFEGRGADGGEDLEGFVEGDGVAAVQEIHLPPPKGGPSYQPTRVLRLATSIARQGPAGVGDGELPWPTMIRAGRGGSRRAKQERNEREASVSFLNSGSVMGAIGRVRGAGVSRSRGAWAIFERRRGGV